MAEEDAYIIRRRAEAASFTTIASELASHSRQDVNTRWRDLVALGKVSGISTLKERQEGMTDGQYKHILALREKGLKWREIASHLQQRLAIVKNTFYLKSLQQNANAAFQRWTDADIAMLTRLREEDRKSWTEIANTMNRSYKSVTAKYHEVSPRVSGPAHRSRVHWTKTEDEKLLQLVKQHGTKWSSLSGLIESRTVHAMRQRYTGTLRKS
ncbi:hypothetical protein CKM354_000217400 [Cercospora kikuchii]|uniref:Uncharacterized protein n=1 Tax=Cercospora kikuchii TaxID=84275 RepID=A0A9P3CHM4_9PEZI|nr:uncharacterized protein CKM354_000217400 [Cercospora kikuchii]GIZ38773.1 hypothetical protein CKM354_000217400 [Cercospora kikuchii]